MCIAKADFVFEYSSSSSFKLLGNLFICNGFILPACSPLPPLQSIHFPPNNLQISLFSDSGSNMYIFVPFSHSFKIIFFAKYDLPLPLAPEIVMFELGLSVVFMNGSNIIALPSSSVPK